MGGKRPTFGEVSYPRLFRENATLEVGRGMGGTTFASPLLYQIIPTELPEQNGKDRKREMGECSERAKFH